MTRQNNCVECETRKRPWRTEQRSRLGRQGWPERLADVAKKDALGSVRAEIVSDPEIQKLFKETYAK